MTGSWSLHGSAPIQARASTCNAVGGMPLAVTQEDFVFITIFMHAVSRISSENEQKEYLSFE